MTDPHSRGCEIAARALREVYDLNTVIDVERKRGERPDVFGWPKHNMFHAWWTHVAEVKVSREDLLRDSDKLHRDTQHSMGDYFWLFMPRDMVDPDTIPPGIGLYWLLEDGRYEYVLDAARRDESHARRNAELKMIGEYVRKEQFSPKTIRAGKWNDVILLLDKCGEMDATAIKHNLSWTASQFREFTNATERRELPDQIQVNYQTPKRQYRMAT